MEAALLINPVRGRFVPHTPVSPIYFFAIKEVAYPKREMESAASLFVRCQAPHSHILFHHAALGSAAEEHHRFLFESNPDLGHTRMNEKVSISSPFLPAQETFEYF